MPIEHWSDITIASSKIEFKVYVLLQEVQEIHKTLLSCVHEVCCHRNSSHFVMFNQNNLVLLQVEYYSLLIYLI